MNRTAIWALILGLLFGPAFFVSHELAHHATARAMGWDVTLHWGWVSFGEDESDVVDLDAYAASLNQRVERAVVVYFLSGPVTTLVCGAIGLLLLSRQSRRASAEAGFAEWVGLCLLAFTIRSPVVLLEQALADWGAIPSGMWGDEVSAATLLGLPRYGLLTVFALVACFVLLAALPYVLRLVRAQRFALAGLSACSGCSFLAWCFLLGPWMLP